MRKTNPLVSIVLPTYNGSGYISQSINSCLNQTYKKIELLIVDDASTDGTLKIIKSYQDKRIKLIRHKKNRGLAASLNTGFGKAKGSYLTWTSDDNYYDRRAIKIMVSFLQKNKGDFVYCNYYHFKDDDPSELILINLNDEVNFALENGIGACFLYSKKVKKRIGNYDINLPLVEDYDYWIRVSRKFKPFHLNKPLYYFRRHEKSLTAKYSQNEGLKKAVELVKRKNNIINTNRRSKNFIELIKKFIK
ncbi:MAG: glycosyltransferase [Actinobacteria bacterium]|nr:glycosyltransferase [Actinomycetota bacterium]